MTEKNLTGLEMLLRLFSRMIYLGIILAIVGVVVGVFLPGVEAVAVISLCVGAGAMMVIAGLTGRRRSGASLERLRGQSRGEEHT